MNLIFFVKILFSKFFKLPNFLMYFSYDLCKYVYCRSWKKFFGWGIHLFVGRFGSSKTSSMVQLAYKLAKKYPQLHILTNIRLENFPKHTKIFELKTAQDILKAPQSTLVLIDEIGTIFNSRDFNTSKTAVPKTLFQHLCQCRKRNMMIYATVQRYNLLDKQIRDITADVTTCSISFKHPFSRFIMLKTYDIEEFETYQTNKLYKPQISNCNVFVQSELNRQLYDTSQLIDNMLQKEYLDDREILSNREMCSSYSYIDKQTKKAYNRRNKF